MKKLFLVIVALGFAGYAFAGSGNPMSNILYDTAATANNLVMRDGNGAIDGQQLTNLSISQARLASSAVSTTQLFIDLPQTRIACVTSTKLLGVCTGSISLALGFCNCTTTVP